MSLLNRLQHPCVKSLSSSRLSAKVALCHRTSINDNFTTTQRRWSNSGTSTKVVYTEEQRKQDHKHCIEMVQNRDFEGYLCGLLMPSSSQEAYFALRAFNVEIASIKDASQLIGGRRSRGGQSSSNNQRTIGNATFDEVGDERDPNLASKLRMQWWKDSILDIYSEKQQQHSDTGNHTNQNQHDDILSSLTSSRKHNPTLRALNYAIHKHQLTHRFLRRIMEARSNDLDILQYETLRDMAQYGEDTVSNVLYLSLETVGIRDEQTDMIASDIGVGLGILTALRSTGFRATQGECSIPLDLANKYNVDMDTLWNAWDASIHTSDAVDELVEKTAASQEALRSSTREMADFASFHLHRARDAQSTVPKDGRSCLLPAVCGLQYLDSLKECNYNVLHPSLVGGDSDTSGIERKRRLSLMFLLGRTWLTGTF